MQKEMRLPFAVCVGCLLAVALVIFGCAKTTTEVPEGGEAPAIGAPADQEPTVVDEGDEFQAAPPVTEEPVTPDPVVPEPSEADAEPVTP